MLKIYIYKLWIQYKMNLQQYWIEKMIYHLIIQVKLKIILKINKMNYWIIYMKERDKNQIGKLKKS